MSDDPFASSLPPAIAPEAEEFVSRAVAALDGFPAERHRAAAELMERLQHVSPPSGSATLAESLERLRKAEKRITPVAMRKQQIRLVFLVVGLMLSVFLLVFDHAVDREMATGSSSVLDPLGVKAVVKMRQQAMRVGEPIVSSYWREENAIAELRRKQEASPKDPALYQAWVQAYSAWLSAGELPADFNRRWPEMEPGNALWAMLYLGSGHRIGDPIEEARETISELQRISRMPEWVDHRRELAVRQRAAFRRPATLAEDAYLRIQLGNISLPEPNVGQGEISMASQWMRPGVDLIPNERDFIEAWSRLAKLRVSQPGANSPVLPPDFNPELARIRRVSSHLSGDSPALPESLGKAIQAFEMQRSIFTADERNRDSYRHLRLAEYASADRGLIRWTGGFFVLLLTFSAWVGSKQTHSGLSTGLAPLFPRSSLARICWLGVLLPLLAWWAVVDVSPFGLRQIHPYFLGSQGRFLHMHLSAWQMLGGVLTVLCCTIAAGGRELRLRAGFLGLGLSHAWVGWIMAIVSFATVVMPGLNPERTMDAAISFRPNKAVEIMLAIVLLWLLWQLWSAVSSISNSAVFSAVFSRLAQVPLILASGLLLLSVPLLHAVERYHIARDPWSSGTPEEARIDGQINLFREALRRAEYR